MSRSRSPLGVEVVPSIDHDESATDLKAVLTSLFDETDSRDGRELIAEVDALVSGVVRELHHEIDLAPPPEPPRAVAPAEPLGRIAPWRTSSPMPIKRPVASIVPLVRPIRTRRSQSPRVLAVGLGAALLAVIAIVWLMVGVNAEPGVGAGAASAPPPPTASPAPVPTAATFAAPVSPAPVADATPALTSAARASVTAPPPRRAVEVSRPVNAPPSPSAPLLPASGAASASEPPRTPVVAEPVGDAGPAASGSVSVETAARVAVTDPPAVEARAATSAPAPSAGTVEAAPPVVEPAASAAAPIPSTAGATALKRDPRLLKRVMPMYPPQLLAARIGGVVRLGVSVDARGRVTSVQATGAHELLRREASLAAEQWEYEPAADAGVPTESHIVVYLTFDPQTRRRQ